MLYLKPWQFQFTKWGFSLAVKFLSTVKYQYWFYVHTVFVIAIQLVILLLRNDVTVLWTRFWYSLQLPSSMLGKHRTEDKVFVLKQIHPSSLSRTETILSGNQNTNRFSWSSKIFHFFMGHPNIAWGLWTRPTGRQVGSMLGKQW